MADFKALTIDQGGTNATTASDARTELGVAYGTTALTVLEGSKDAEYVKLAGSQTITGGKTFTSSILADAASSSVAGLKIRATNVGKNEFIEFQNDGGAKRMGIIYDNSVPGFGIQNRTGGDLVRIVESTGNVGIGTTSPGAKFHSRTSAVTGASYITEANGIIEGVDGCLELVSDRIGSYASTLALTSTDGTNHNNWAIVNGGVSVGGRLRFMYGNTPASGLPNINQEFMSVTTGGNVGINKTNPLSKFAVVGLPTSSAGLTSGDVWRNGTVLNIIA